MLDKQILSSFQDALRCSVKQIVDEFAIEPLCNKLIGIPEEIRKLQDAALAAQKDVDQAKCKVETAKSVIVAMVTSEVNGNGKPVYSNETARNAEITRRMANDPDYLVAKQSLQDAEERVANIRFDIERLNSEMTNLRAVLNARAAQIMALFGG